MLFNDYPTHRRADPETSRQEVPNQREIKKKILNTIRQFPEGITAGELGHVSGIEGVWKRLSELEKDGFIVRGTPKLYARTNRWQATWSLAQERQLTFL